MIAKKISKKKKSGRCSLLEISKSVKYPLRTDMKTEIPTAKRKKSVNNVQLSA